MLRDVLSNNVGKTTAILTTVLVSRQLSLAHSRANRSELSNQLYTPSSNLVVYHPPKQQPLQSSTNGTKFNYLTLAKEEELNIKLRAEIKKGNLKEFINLISNKNINKLDKRKYLSGLMHAAIQVNDLDMLKLLIACDANVNENDPAINNGPSPLHYAARTGNYAAAEILLTNTKAIVNVDMQTSVPPYTGHHKNTAPLHYAAAAGHVELVKLLLRFNANINIENDYKETPLLLATRQKHHNVVNYLLEIGAKPNNLRETKLTPPNIFISNVVKSLLGQGAPYFFAGNNKKAMEKVLEATYYQSNTFIKRPQLLR